MKQLRRLFDGFQYPGEFITETRHHLTGEEVFLFGIYRLSRSENFHDLISMGLMFATKTWSLDHSELNLLLMRPQLGKL